MDVRMYPDDGGLKDQLHSIDSTTSLVSVLTEHFFPAQYSLPLNTNSGCRVCGMQFADSLGRPIAMGYCCPRNDCPTQARATS